MDAAATGTPWSPWPRLVASRRAIRYRVALDRRAARALAALQEEEHAASALQRGRTSAEHERHHSSLVQQRLGQEQHQALLHRHLALAEALEGQRTQADPFGCFASPEEADFVRVAAVAALLGAAPVDAMHDAAAAAAVSAARAAAAPHLQLAGGGAGRPLSAAAAAAAAAPAADIQPHPVDSAWWAPNHRPRSAARHRHRLRPQSAPALNHHPAGGSPGWWLEPGERPAWTASRAADFQAAIEELSNAGVVPVVAEGGSIMRQAVVHRQRQGETKTIVHKTQRLFVAAGSTTGDSDRPPSKPSPARGRGAAPAGRAARRLAGAAGRPAAAGACGN